MVVNAIRTDDRSANYLGANTYRTGHGKRIEIRANNNQQVHETQLSRKPKSPVSQSNVSVKEKFGVTADPHANKRIYSVGHSNHDINDFLGLLKLHGVNTLVDVRGSPSGKRFPQYNKLQLISSCNANNITYRHCSQLGNKQRKIQTLIELPHGQAAIKQLYEEYFAFGSNATAIMRSEHDNDTCHRKIVAQRLYDDYNINTKHIGRIGSIAEHVARDINAQSVDVILTTNKIMQAIGRDKFDVDASNS